MSAEWIVNLDNLELEDLTRGERFGKQASFLSRTMGAKKLGFHLEVMPPGAFSYPYHFHHAQEELFLVMEGRAMLRYNGEFREVGPGDLVFCPRGPKAVHQFHNHTDEDFRFLALSNDADVEVCEYPDSGKVLATGAGKLFLADSAVGYLHGEEDPGAHWPEEHLRKKG